MAAKQVKLEIDLKDREVRRKLQQLAREAGDLGDEFDGAESAGQAMARAIERSAEDMKAEIDATARAVETMERALDGVDIDPREVVADLKRVGLTADEVEAAAEDLATALRSAGDVKVYAAERGFSDLGQAVDSVRAESDRASSATNGFLGGMVGDSAAAVTGIGPLGEAISQVVEGLVEGEVGFKRMLTAAGGMAGIAAAALVVAEVVGTIRERQQRLEEATERWADALQEAREEAEAIEDILADRETFSDEELDALDRLNVSLEERTMLLGMDAQQMSDWLVANKGAKRGSEELEQSFFDQLTVVEALTREQQALSAAVSDSERDARIGIGTTEEATVATEDHADAMAEATEAAQEEAEAHREVADALNEQIDARMGAVDANYALRDAEREFAEQLAEATEQLAEAEQGSAEYQEILDTTAESAADLAEAQVRVAEETARAEGRTLAAQQRMDLFNRSMINSAATAEGPLRQAILDHIAAVNEIPASAVTEIEAALDRGDIAEAERILNDTSRTRRTAITADLNRTSADDIERRLNSIARGRTVHIGVSANPSIRGAYAKGTQYAPGGTALVGERGPELVDLPMGSKVTPAGRTESVLREGSSGGSTTVNITQNFPAGARPADVASAQRRYRRIQGEL